MACTESELRADQGLSWPSTVESFVAGLAEAGADNSIPSHHRVWSELNSRSLRPQRGRLQQTHGRLDRARGSDNCSRPRGGRSGGSSHLASSHYNSSISPAYGHSSDLVTNPARTGLSRTYSHFSAWLSFDRKI